MRYLYFKSIISDNVCCEGKCLIFLAKLPQVASIEHVTSRNDDDNLSTFPYFYRSLVLHGRGSWSDVNKYQFHLRGRTSDQNPYLPLHSLIQLIVVNKVHQLLYMASEYVFKTFKGHSLLCYTHKKLTPSRVD